MMPLYVLILGCPLSTKSLNIKQLGESRLSDLEPEYFHFSNIEIFSVFHFHDPATRAHTGEREGCACQLLSEPSRHRCSGRASVRHGSLTGQRAKGWQLLPVSGLASLWPP